VTCAGPVCEVEAGYGACTILSAPCEGRVVATFAQAQYLRFAEGVVALTDRRVPRGPLYVRLPALPALEKGQSVRVDEVGVLHLGQLRVAPQQPGWSGARPPRSLLANAHEIADKVLRPIEPPELLADPHIAARVRTVIHSGGLGVLARQLGGRGPGLTPAGDDILAGVLFVASLAAQNRSEQDRLITIARTVETNDIAAAFLIWAAHGHSIEPVHDFVVGSTVHDRDRARRAASEVLRFGSSSGRALAHGIGLGLRHLPALRCSTA